MSIATVYPDPSRPGGVAAGRMDDHVAGLHRYRVVFTEVGSRGRLDGGAAAQTAARRPFI